MLSEVEFGPMEPGVILNDYETFIEKFTIRSWRNSCLPRRTYGAKPELLGNCRFVLRFRAV